jgi:hypothetical protein
MHTVIVVDGNAQPLRVSCDYCRSEHNFRGGPRSLADAGSSASALRATADKKEPAPRTADRAPRTETSMPQSDSDLEATIRRIIREESGLTAVAPAEKWRGGQLVLKPGRPGVQEKTVPIDTFFNKIVMLRNRLRTLEQQVNASELPDDQKMKLQGYITGCYGSLTTFNVLFAQDDDKFVGSGD